MTTICLIGVMMGGFYILTRMLSFLCRKQPRDETNLVKVLSVVTIIVTSLGLLSLIFAGCPPK